MPHLIVWLAGMNKSFIMNDISYKGRLSYDEDMKYSSIYNFYYSVKLSNVFYSTQN